MPLYEYLCVNCMKLLEFIVPLDKFDKKIKCPHCKKEVKRIMSSVLFKVN
jgi:putative FmdB family regulatory protein